ncbi:MAG: hypothetical protein LBD67_07790 [Candidatus Accumulibacter sp.]|jgi:hypothetical protein|nr:hypothetical protein [Accumulibacter sp.]
MRRKFSGSTQHGSVLLLLAIVLTVAAAGFFLARFDASSRKTRRSEATGEALLQAKEALIGFAITYRYTHSGEGFGYLPCPDTNDDGYSEPVCGAVGVSVIGRLPWKTLGLPTLRDASSECLWYAVSGAAKDNPKTVPLNWDTQSQFVVRDVAGNALAGGVAAPHDGPLAVIFAPDSLLDGQTRTQQINANCGDYLPAAYLEGLGALASGSSDAAALALTVASAESANTRIAPPHPARNNDRAVWISSRDIFDRIKRRIDFKNDIDTLMNDLANYLNNLPPTALPAMSAGNKGIDAIINGYLSANPSLPEQKAKVFANWRDNLLYAGGPAGAYFINSSASSCRALLFFGGERVTRSVAPLVSQSRVEIAEKGAATMYLEDNNALLFPSNGNYGNSASVFEYDPANPGADIIRCINGLPAGSASFDAAQISGFTAAGSGLTIDTPPGSPTQVSVTAPNNGETGACFWYSTPIPLAGKTLRAYYEFRFHYADESVLNGATQDRGYGITLQMTGNDNGVPNECGKKTNLGALAADSTWGIESIIIETDIYKSTAHSDPSENHTAILTNGRMKHAAGSLNTACNGTSSGCRHAPANRFEEGPVPPFHNQRIEIITGCDSNCASCVPAAHAPPNKNYAQIAVWSDCADCDDIALSLNHAIAPPTIQYCHEIYHPEMNSVYIGLTVGLRYGASPGAPPSQALTFRNLRVRSE